MDEDREMLDESFAVQQKVKKVNKTVSRKIRFRPDEVAQLDDFLKEMDLSFSQFVRDAVALRQSVPKATTKKRVTTAPPPQVDPALLLEIGRIGTNINQIARSLNILKNDESQSELRAQFSFAECLRVLLQMLEELQAVIGELPKISRSEEAVQKARMRAIQKFLPEVEENLEEPAC